MKDLQRHRGEFIVPGPNYAWSIDGHMKLAPYGIEIYAAIDAYSRYIIWIYVGISGLTAVSVLSQYLDAVKAANILPHLLRSDRGNETLLIADAHWQFHRTKSPDIQFRAVYAYGTSNENQRIESWWTQLTSGALPYWRVSFLTYLRTNKTDFIK